MLGTEKKEQRGQAVKRLRSLFDMHHIPVGAPENLGGVVLSLHENRHFAMDFWALVGALTSSESAALSDEEMLETVLESASGTESLAIAESLLPGVTELRQMLAGVDVAQPLELPDAISEPGDELLPQRKHSLERDVKEAPQQMAEVRQVARPMHRVEQAAPRPMPVADARAARRSIGEALARLEQTSRELREQLTAIDEHAAAAEQIGETANAYKFGSREAASLDLPQQAEPVAEARRDVDGVSMEPVRETLYAPEPTGTATEAQPGPQRGPQPASHVERPPAPVAAPAPEQPVFVPRRVHRLSQRGWATPEPDDDPAIVAPLSGYDAEQEPLPIARIVVGVVLLVALIAGRFFAARPDVGHMLLSSAGTSLHAAYRNIAERLSLLKREATTPTRYSADDTTDGGTTPAERNSTPADANRTVGDAPAPGAPVSNATADPATWPGASEAAKPQLTVTPQTPLKRPTADDTTATRHAPVKSSAADERVLRVPASKMATNLVASRVPAYPEAAKAQEIEGPVELEIIVAPSGAVKLVQAIDGDRHLRAAAEEAVTKWRYRPYLLNGRPVEIITTVRVDFRLPK